MTELADRHANQAAGRGWQALARLVSAMLVLLERAGLSIHARRLHVLRLLRPAEVLARRLLVLMAAGLKEPVAVRDRQPLPDTAGWSAQRNGPQPFGFVEPLAGGFSNWFGISAGREASRPSCSAGDEATGRVEAGLERIRARLAALQAVLDDPRRQAKRVARWMRAGGQARRSLPICMARPPGGRPGHLDRDTVSLLLDLHHFARTVEWPP